MEFPEGIVVSGVDDGASRKVLDLVGDEIRSYPTPPDPNRFQARKVGAAIMAYSDLQ